MSGGWRFGLEAGWAEDQLLNLKGASWLVAALLPPLMILGIVGMVAFTRATKFLQGRMLGRALRSNDQLCIHCGYDLTTENLRCPECGNVYTLAGTREAWKNLRDEHVR